MVLYHTILLLVVSVKYIWEERERIKGESVEERYRREMLNVKNRRSDCVIFIAGVNV